MASIQGFASATDAVAEFLDRKGILSTNTPGDPARVRDLRKAEKSLGYAFPDPLKKFYLEYGDGTNFFWELEDNWGSLTVPTLAELVDNRRQWDDLTGWMVDYEYSGTEDPARAKQTFASMKSWIPLIETNNGDLICVDLAEGPGCIRYHEHDWFDGGDGGNGFVMAPDLETFVSEWSKVCFISPPWWSDVVGDGGIKWDAPAFPNEFRLDPADRLGEVQPGA